MSNFSFSQSLDGLNNIDADNISTSTINVNAATITSLNNSNLINCISNTPSAPQSIVNKNYVDSNFVDRTNNLTESINGVKTFSSIPLCSLTASINNQLVNFFTLNNQGFTTLTLVQANNNVWTGTNTFNTSLPTSTITASTPNQLVNFTTLNSQNFTTLPIVQANNNVWTGTNSFTTNIPTTTNSATTSTQLVNFNC